MAKMTFGPRDDLRRRRQIRDRDLVVEANEADGGAFPLVLVRALLPQHQRLFT